jgi:SseB protein N-terminal domain
MDQCPAMVEDTRLVDVLRRTSRGEASFAELAEVLASLQDLFVIVSPKDLVRYLAELTAKVGPKLENLGRVRADDAPAPSDVGITTKDGFVPLVFTDDGIAREYAVTAGLIQPDEVLTFRTVTPARGLYEALARGCPGMVLDDGSDHKINLHRDSMSRLYAVMSLSELASRPSLHVLTSGDEPVVQTSPKGNRVAFAYESQETAIHGLRAQKQPGLGTRPMPTAALLEWLLRAGVGRLVVDAALPFERLYDRDDLVAMLHHCGGDPSAADPTGPDPALEPAPGAVDAAAAPQPPGRPEARALACVPPPGRDPDESRAVFQALRVRAEKRAINLWEYIDSMAFDLDLWVPVYPEPVDGFIWPLLSRHPDKEDKRIVFTFSHQPTAEAMMPGVRFAHLSGIEAMRWVWAAPKHIDEIAIDLHKDTGGWLTFPNYWVLSAVYPQFIDVPDPAAVARVGLVRLGGLPGARGTKPEVARALAADWRELVTITDADGAPPPPVEYDGRRCLPVFSDPKQCFAFLSTHRRYPQRPVRAGAEPPFGAWLAAASGCDGVVLDPTGPWPLVLDHTDLLWTELWARAGKPPEAGEVVAEVSRLRHAGTLSPALAARLVADWPRYFIGVARTETGGNVLKLPEGDVCAVFTSAEKANFFIDAHRTLGLFQGIEGMKPMPILHRWTHSVFHAVAEQFEAACIDPEPRAGTGLHLDQAGLAAAIERIEERLQPRVPGFVAADG